MSSYINAALRRLVAIRADSLCEYCLIHEEDAFFGCEVDHIIKGLKLTPPTAGSVYLDAPASQRWEAACYGGIRQYDKTRELCCPSSTSKFFRLQPKNQTEESF